MNLREKGVALTHEDLKTLQEWQHKNYDPDQLAMILVRMYDELKSNKKSFPRDLKKVDRMVKEIFEV